MAARPQVHDDDGNRLLTPSGQLVMSPSGAEAAVELRDQQHGSGNQGTEIAK